jgi:hypothetical protein
MEHRVCPPLNCRSYKRAVPGAAAAARAAPHQAAIRATWLPVSRHGQHPPIARRAEALDRLGDGEPSSLVISAAALPRDPRHDRPPASTALSFTRRLTDLIDGHDGCQLSA